MVNGRVVRLLALALPAMGILLACAAAPVVPASPGQEQIPVAPPSASAAASASVETPASAAPAPSAEPAPLCIGGEIMMGACICPSGHGVDATGHCVFMTKCPKSVNGGIVFRDETTGQCKECRPGTKPVPGGGCAR
jgi:hypothetical protein